MISYIAHWGQYCSQCCVMVCYVRAGCSNRRRWVDMRACDVLRRLCFKVLCNVLAVCIPFVYVNQIVVIGA